MSQPNRAGAMGAQEVLTGDLEYFTLYTSFDLTRTGDFNDATQKDFESVVQVIALRAMPVIMNTPVELDGTGNNTLENFGAPTLTGPGWIFKFAFERDGVHTIATLSNELNGIVLNAGTIDTSGTVNMEFTKQDLL
jgi:hypothetical protein